ncbi:MAG: galactosyldiacylglycerol synthase [Spirochaetae bacterium HGW-Spirochaetae-3]|jgi:processive 1,2-diacylglycerol beta-glucosyltransferase|nr:MAG: galactosyldiacylglycerol synthase [Spirochaetae bacterium HGW-Spirochaetae-3]
MGKRVMILAASAGSGHVKAAQALEEACRNDPRVSEVCRIDALQYTNFLFKRVYSKGYMEAVKSAPELWAMAFENLDKPWEKTRLLTALQRFNSLPLARKIRAFNPDLCICTHFMPADLIAYMISHDKVHCNLGIVVTDFYVHALWLEEVFTRYFVAKPENKNHLQMLGLPAERIVVSGIPVMEQFTIDISKETLHAKYQTDPSIPVVVLSAGAFGIMTAKVIYKILEQIKTPCQIVVICGKNKALKAALEKLIASSDHIHNKYVIEGFVDTMHEYLKLADVFIGKPGGLATSECLVSGVPMVVWDPIPGQELYNTYHILENGVGVLPDNIITIGFKVDQILSNPERMKKMKKQALAIASPKAASMIVDSMLQNDEETPVRAFKKTP